ncbi:unnamed protein product [Rotaria sp. Silwood1]|nr:unnamed protein product [Rotaria sp. Silwood1]CAF1672081.1 unnamed protein product [Rotaria sp. Silwood1]CAF3537429.1 unnamed protein product [Rotaria sp. Silwood1]CAF4729204.1 unnamed protein product [Rotaria sp. Silwood1]CAF5023829.1 unnamed protein product [Rotaria sp. Silwood1]
MVSRRQIQLYNLKYRQKLQHRRAISKSFDLHFKAKQNARQRKCRQRKKEAQKNVAIVPISSSTKIDSRKVEGAKRRRANARKSKNEAEKLLKQVQQLQKENRAIKRLLSQQRSAEVNDVNTTTATSPTHLFINNISPSSKKRATKRLLSEKENLPRGSVSKLRKLGVNLSNNYDPPSSTPSILQKEIEDFLCQDDISKQAPDKKKQLHGKQIRYLLHHLSTVHQRFVTETGNSCHYSTFTRYVPDFVIKPNANDWGTCLCVTCLNPQMKFEKLQNLKSRYSIIKSVLIDGLTDITELVTDEIKTKDFKSNLAILKDEQFTITYSEWIKKKNDESNILVSTKTTITSFIADFVNKFTNEIENLTHHIDRMRQQFRAAKNARQMAMEEDDVATIHLDWSENFKLKQARQDKGK